MLEKQLDIRGKIGEQQDLALAARAAEIEEYKKLVEDFKKVAEVQAKEISLLKTENEKLVVKVKRRGTLAKMALGVGIVLGILVGGGR